eukprot:TRINITY_DN451_c0_g1_i2.p1 TRINITY_DN451_c0_g1~~TRINITY_DN451_c0_g1_i2.p1  ORF type:complete len:54 (-),score=28.26 TRINITY_DN451_c0_g1_i2:2-163(-)
MFKKPIPPPHSFPRGKILYQLMLVFSLLMHVTTETLEYLTHPAYSALIPLLRV